ncbi:MAG: AAA family ATPase [Deltaproteobacteria bacterium]|nr:AAA family ATPase [Deltaproteobacteria bacterium]
MVEHRAKVVGGAGEGAPGIEIHALQEAIRTLSRRFLAKEEIIRLVAISAIAGEHLVVIGPPGTAKSAIIRSFAELCDAHYFEYLLTRFTEPNELFGPIDMAAFREGRYERRTEGMLPEAEIVFLDEVFKANSAILNTLLTVLNERAYTSGGKVMEVPLISVFGASNEVPNDEALDAVFDRFLLRVHADNLESYHFHRLLEAGLDLEEERVTAVAGRPRLQPVLKAEHLRRLRAELPRVMRAEASVKSTYKGLIFQLRSEGVSLSDRRAIKLFKICGASALLAGRERVTEADFAILEHAWNNLDQREIVAEAIRPVLEAYYGENPAERPLQGAASLEDLAGELTTLRERLTGGEPLPDVQLFALLGNLQDLRVALLSHGGETAESLVSEIDRMLEAVFQR